MPRRGGWRGASVEATQDAVGVAGRAYGMGDPQKRNPRMGAIGGGGCHISHSAVLDIVDMNWVDITGVAGITHSVITSVRTLVGETSLGEPSAK